MDAAQLLRDTRRRHGLTQRALARRCRTSQTYIGRIERGEVSPTVDALQKLLQAMGERLELRTVLRQGNQSETELRDDFDLSCGERVLQAAELSYVMTGLAEGVAEAPR